MEYQKHCIYNSIQITEETREHTKRFVQETITDPKTSWKEIMNQ